MRIDRSKKFGNLLTSTLSAVLLIAHIYKHVTSLNWCQWASFREVWYTQIMFMGFVYFLIVKLYRGLPVCLWTGDNKAYLSQSFRTFSSPWLNLHLQINIKMWLVILNYITGRWFVILIRKFRCRFLISKYCTSYQRDNSEGHAPVVNEPINMFIMFYRQIVIYSLWLLRITCTLFHHKINTFKVIHILTSIFKVNIYYLA